MPIMAHPSYAAFNKNHGIKCCAFSDEIFANWMHMGWLLRKEKGQEEREGGWTLTPLRNLRREKQNP